MTVTAPRVHPASEALLNLLYPPHCVVCERPGAWLCSDCLALRTPLPAPLCPHCGRPMPTARLCRRCRAGRSQLVAVRSVGAYTTPLREAIHALKYGGMRVLAQPLAALLAEYWQSATIAVDVIVPVPLHPRRQRYRGYNQAELLACAMAERVGLPVERHGIVRHRDTRSQVGLSVAERHANMQGAFECAGAALNGARVLLIDDVLTTGATLEAAAEAAKAGGAAGVWALTVSRAPDPH